MQIETKEPKEKVREELLHNFWTQERQGKYTDVFASFVIYDTPEKVQQALDGEKLFVITVLNAIVDAVYTQQHKDAILFDIDDTLVNMVQRADGLEKRTLRPCTEDLLTYIKEIAPDLNIGLISDRGSIEKQLDGEIDGGIEDLSPYIDRKYVYSSRHVGEERYDDYGMAEEDFSAFKSFNKPSKFNVPTIAQKAFIIQQSGIKAIIIDDLSFSRKHNSLEDHRGLDKWMDQFGFIPFPHKAKAFLPAS